MQNETTVWDHPQCSDKFSLIPTDWETVSVRDQLSRTGFMIVNISKRGSTTRHLLAYKIVGRDGEIMYAEFSAMIQEDTLQN